MPSSAENWGTFALVFFGPSAAAVQVTAGAPGHLGAAAVFGRTVATVIGALLIWARAAVKPAATFALLLAAGYPRGSGHCSPTGLLGCPPSRAESSLCRCWRGWLPCR